MPGPEANVPDRLSDSHREASTTRPATHDTNTVAFGKQLVPESLEKLIPIPKSLHPHLKYWLEKDSVLHGQPLHPLKHALQSFTDTSTEGCGAYLNEHTARGD